MNINQHIVFIGFLISLSLNAQAEEIGLCDKLEAIQNISQKNNSQQQLERFTLTQFTFDNDARDLAIIVHNVNLPADIKRVTFNRGKLEPSCYFKPIAFAQGGLAEQYWGWHLLWTETDGKLPQGLFYARMDGEAWVSSNPKRLTKLAPINTQFTLDKEMITVTWQQTENGVTANIQAISIDEGRSWEINPIQH